MKREMERQLRKFLLIQIRVNFGLRLQKNRKPENGAKTAKHASIDKLHSFDALK